MNLRNYSELSRAVANFCEEYKDHPLLADTCAHLKQAMYEVDTMLESPGQKAAREVQPSGQEPSGQQPVHQ